MDQSGAERIHPTHGRVVTKLRSTYPAQSQFQLSLITWHLDHRIFRQRIPNSATVGILHYHCGLDLSPPANTPPLRLQADKFNNCHVGVLLLPLNIHIYITHQVDVNKPDLPPIHDNPPTIAKLIRRQLQPHFTNLRLPPFVEFERHDIATNLIQFHWKQGTTHIQPLANQFFNTQTGHSTDLKLLQFSQLVELLDAHLSTNPNFSTTGVLQVLTPGWAPLPISLLPHIRHFAPVITPKSGGEVATVTADHSSSTPNLMVNVHTLIIQTPVSKQQHFLNANGLHGLTITLLSTCLVSPMVLRSGVATHTGYQSLLILTTS
jgi:hypothetical protein